MAEHSYFWPDKNGDREYDENDLDEYAGGFLTHGVYNGDLAVKAGGNMSVIVPAGKAFVGPAWTIKKYYNDSDLTLQIANADGVLHRKDIIVLRKDINERIITAQVIQGTPASNPAAPQITRNAELYDLELAEISIPAGTTAITQAMINDTRLDSTVCGIVTGAMQQVDTTTFYNQIKGDLADFKSTNEADFSAWLSSIKGKLSEDAAGNLQSEIDAHKSDKSNPHGVTAEQAGAVKGNTASYYATAVSMNDSNHAYVLTVPDFTFSEGCKVTFKVPTLPIEDAWMYVVIGGTAYALRTTTQEMVTNDAWKVNSFITVTLTQAVVIDLGTSGAGRSGTAFFKKGGGYGTLAAQINNFYATIGDASVRLTWSNPPDGNYAGVAIIRKTGGYPSKVLDGVKIYEGSAQAFTDTGLANGTQYFYRAFAYNSKHEYQTEYCVATMTPLHGYQLGTFPVGTKLKVGTIFGNAIVFKIANISGNDVTLIADGVLARYAFDAKEPANGDSSRVSYGNNRYILSNIHQWLNSEAGAGSWYVAQHSADQAPDSTSVVSANPYKSAAGFLNGFSTKEKNYLKTKTVTVGKSNTDGGGTETFNARFWLPSGTEVGLATDFTEGSQLSVFSDNNSRIAYETADCAANTGGTSGAAQYYWLRTPYASYSYYVRVVNSGGTLHVNYAYDGGNGVRPLCVLDSSVLLSLSPDGSGAYTLA